MTRGQNVAQSRDETPGVVNPNLIVLPFPPASLSGHAKGHFRAKAGVTSIWRALATVGEI